MNALQNHNDGSLVAVTGATGFVGTEVVRQARAAGFRVRAIVRDSKRARTWVEQEDVELVCGDVLAATSLADAFAGVSAIVHLVGIVVEHGRNTFEHVHIDATRHVVDAAKRAGARRYVHLSALGTRADARSRYHQTKWAAEEYVRQSGLAWTIFRPSVIYGPGDKAINVLAKVMRRLPFVPVLGDGNAKVQPVSVAAVAQAVVGALKKDASVGKTYDLCGPASFTWNELYDKLLAFYGLRKPKWHLPLSMARLQAAVLEKLLPNPPFTRDQLRMITEDNAGDPQPAVRDFCLELETFEQGITRYLVR
jgi:NADH dehydrogenase